MSNPYDERTPSPWPWVEIRDDFWTRFFSVVFVPFALPAYIILTIPALVWSACAVILDGALEQRINWWTPLWEGTAYYEARWRKKGGSRA